MKVCPKCKQAKDESEFGKETRRKDKLHVWCKTCANAWHRAFYYSHHEEKLAYAADYRAKNRELLVQRTVERYRQKIAGCSPEQYNSYFTKQNGLCAICGQPPRNKGLGVDHNHKTGEIRALLCSSCNLILGHAHDDPAILEAAAAYLRRVNQC